MIADRRASSSRRPAHDARVVSLDDERPASGDAGDAPPSGGPARRPGLPDLHLGVHGAAQGRRWSSMATWRARSRPGTEAFGFGAGRPDRQCRLVLLRHLPLRSCWRRCSQGAPASCCRRGRRWTSSLLVDELGAATILHAVPARDAPGADSGAAAAAAARSRPAGACSLGGDAVPADLLADLRQAFPGGEIRGALRSDRDDDRLRPSGGCRPSGRASPCSAARSPGWPIHAAATPAASRCRSACRGRSGSAARGWPAATWRRPELTAERFVTRRPRGRPERLYRSGDLARRLPDGDAGVPGPHRPPGQDPRLPHRAGGDRGRAGGPAGRARGRGPGARRRSRRRARWSPTWRPDRRPTRRRPARRPGRRLPDYMLPGGVRLPRRAAARRRAARSTAGRSPRRRTPGRVRGGRPCRRAPRWSASSPRQFREVLGLPAGREIGVDDDFFELGGTSITSAIFIHRLQEALAEVVHVVAIFDHPTVAGLAALRSTPRGRGTTGAGTRRARRPAGAGRAGAAPGGRARPPAALLRPFGGRRGRLLPRAGAPSGPRPAGSMACSRPIRRSGISGRWPARYAAAIREVQPAGPYRIAGWSMGGIVAYEMARQLEALGEEVPRSWR